MKLLRVGNPGEEVPAIIDGDGAIRSLAGVVDDIAGDVLSDAGLDRLRGLDVSSLPVVDAATRIGPCVGDVGKFICVGLNYSDHAAETGMAIPAEPILFFKATTAICGPNDDALIPRNSEKTDWEVEFGVVIGKTARYVSEADAMDHVAGYCVINDVSERAFQIERGGQWVKGKSCDSFAPIGPFLATPDELADVNDLPMWLKVNGETMQDGNTSNLIFKIPTIVSYLSQFMTLLPGDLISTGTPAGVGLGMKPPKFLKPGDVIELGIEGLGEQRQEAVACP